MDPSATSSSGAAAADRPVLPIDLNEAPPTPPPLDALSLVLQFHGNPAAPPGPPADHPGEAGAGASPAPCGLCGRAETRGGTVVCDACERGFHISCARFRPSRVHGALEDWLCSDCSERGAKKKRWTLGAARLLDINALPPTDDELQSGGAGVGNPARMNNPHGASSNGIGVQFSPANMDHVRNAFDPEKYTGMLVDAMEKNSGALPHHGLSSSRGFEDPVFVPSSVGRRAVSNATISGHQEEEGLLQFLRDFIAGRGGILGKGWHVEFKESIDSSGRCAIYCAPNGKKFESIYDVAHYLGRQSSFIYVGTDERGDGSDIVHESSTHRRRKKYNARIPTTNCSLVNQASLRSRLSGEIYFEAEVMENQYCDVRSSARGTKSSLEEDGLDGSQDLIVGLPVQYEDFYVISLGKVSLQTSYHDKSQIWPIGYRSNWHDKITGSLFECEVSNGGDSGPVFRVRRCSCSVLPVPNGVTVLVHNNTNKDDNTEKRECGSLTLDTCCGEDDDILVLLSDTIPSELGFLSSLTSDFDGNSNGSVVPMDIQKQGIATPDLDCHPERSVEPLRDEIGEFYVEGRSSCSVWKMVSQTIIDACREAYKQAGCLHFFCKHNDEVYSDGGIVEDVNRPSSLMRFCSSSGPINIPRIIQNDTELEASCKSLAKWIDQDRFGLDVGFVQEIVEALPGSRACSSYQFLNDRNDSSTSVTVGSGSLLAIQKPKQGGEKVVPYGLPRGPIISNMQDSVTKLINCQPPQGRPLSNRLPVQLVGDFFQIWEFLWRFSEILGLKEALSFEEIEEELVDPWPCGSQKEIQVCKDPNSQGIGSANDPEPLSGESYSTGYGEDSIIFIPVETAFSREAAETKVAACTYGRCHGATLTKIHISLLKVLVGELVCRVAGFVGPNSYRETKSRRGRKKDVDTSLLVKETKVNILINELTWPEIARRYVLAVSSTNDCMDSQELSSRKGVKMFRCLQGDGGVLCGSLCGVAGMEADALLLAEAERQISGPLKREKEILLMDKKDLHVGTVCEPPVVNGNGLPEWAEPLGPVRKLPTNVGTRIRKCIYESLAKNPPDWARKILEHSISKEVYKGNASGPTKKAVLSLLAEVSSGNLPKKSDKQRKESSPISVTEGIMRKCRIVLRRSVSADEGEVFCNLLGTTLVNSSDSVGNGVIGLPAMVSRPLDFRTIDLRLAVGAYVGSHEAFHEDVREVWHNICIAYGERPDKMQLAETLAQNFESLYEKEVLGLVQKLVDHGNIERIDPELHRELYDMLLSTNEIPKAPWEKGVCKVCGLDKDDDSVLLCDSCDSEYHTYCLNPPLARIPVENWYCPSCVASQNEKQGASPCTNIIRRHSRGSPRKETQAFQDSLNQLAITMKDKEYWEFSTEERIFLLKFLCDEVLNSVLIRDNLEQCPDKLSDLQQKLRSLSIEWKSLKSKEDSIVTRTVKEHIASKYGGADDVMTDGTSTMYANHGNPVVQQPISDAIHVNQDSPVVPQQTSDNLNYATFLSGNSKNPSSLPIEEYLGNGQKDANKNMNKLLGNTTETHENAKKVSDAKIVISETYNSDGDVTDKPTISGNIFSLLNSNKCARLNGQVEQSLLVFSHGAGGEVVHVVDPPNAERKILDFETNNQHCSGKKNILNKDQDGSVLQTFNILHKSCMSSDNGKSYLEQGTTPVPMESGVDMSVGESPPPNQDVAYQGKHNNFPVGLSESGTSMHEIDSLRDEISHLEDSIATLQSQIRMTSLRRDFLGRDSFDRLYWFITRPGRRPWLVVDGSNSMARERTDPEETIGHNSNSLLDLSSKHPAPGKHNHPSESIADDQSNSCSSEISCRSSLWVFYESDSEIRELVSWLRESDPRERDLKESMLQIFQCYQDSNLIPEVSQVSSKSSHSEIFAVSLCLTTKASTILKTNFGASLEMEVSEIPKRRGRKAKSNCEDRIYRCECLEPVWPSRHHCLSCHQTFCTAIELEGHNDGRCTPTNRVFDESKVSEDSLKGKGIRSESTREKEQFDEVSIVEASKSGKLDISFKLIKPRKKMCPYDLDEISKKFTTEISNEALVKEIGLIGSNGIPSFIQSSTVVFDPPLILNQNIYTTNLDNGITSSDECLRLAAEGFGIKANATHFDNGSGTGCVSKTVQSCLGNVIEKHLPEGKGSTFEYTGDGEKSASKTNKIKGLDVCHNCTIPESSLRPLSGKISHILKRLKINLLDMEAAISDEALRPLKSHTVKRCAWRAYVKSAESIFEMVQATILFEGMIKSEYMKNRWWYWSSLTAAAKTSTISSLAHRIYTLDDCIIYIKDPLSASDPKENTRPAPKIGKKRKGMETGS